MSAPVLVPELVHKTCSGYKNPSYDSANYSDTGGHTPSRNYWQEAGLRGGFYEAKWRKQGTEDSMIARIGKGTLTLLMAG